MWSESAMEDFGSVNGGQNAALIILTFLQADCRDPEYVKELRSLRQEVDRNRDINANNPWGDAVEDGSLQTDGHLSLFLRGQMADIEPSVELQRAGQQDNEAIQRVAGELREIAAQLEHDVVARATQNLSRKMLDSPVKQWKDLLSQEVERVMHQGVGLEDLPQERVIMVLTLTLVKELCVRAPRLMRSLYSIALQHFGG